jgi:hypothetical protein
MENRNPHLNGDSSNENRSIDPTIKDNIFTGIKNARVSIFDSVLSKSPTEVSILEILELIQSENLKPQIENIRQQASKAVKDSLKKKLPCVTISGSFLGGHAANNLHKHSGLIQVDIDDLSNVLEAKARLRKDSFIYSCFISPSGNGLKCIVKIPSDNHQASFEFVQDYFREELKLTIDAKCRDVGRLMYLTHDPDIYINENALIMNETTISINKILTEIERRQIDITSKYEDWFKIGLGFSNEFGENGRELFHKVSRINPSYEPKKCDDQFSNCLKADKGETTIKTFFFLAKSHGIAPFKSEKDTARENKPTVEPDKKNFSKFKLVEDYLNFKYEIRYNSIAYEFEIRKKEDSSFTSLNEDSLYRELQHNSIHFSQANIMALLRSDFVAHYDPINHYFTNLEPWDGVDHIQRLSDHIHAKDQPRFNLHLRKALVRSVNCGFGQGFNKQAFILTGGQSSGKTTFIRWLCPPKLHAYYSENITTDKDSLLSLAQNFITNLDELATMSKMDLNSLKSMLSKDLFKARPPYGKKPITAKRKTNFFGSTNKDEFLNDETGSVRWLCFEIEKIDWDYKQKIDIDKVWAQSYHLLKNGYKFNLTEEEIKENEIMNSNHTLRTPELELAQIYFEASEKGHPGAESLTATEVLAKLRVAGHSLNHSTPVSMGKALTQLGFKSINVRTGNDKVPRKIYWLKFIYPTTLTTPTT